MIGMKLFEWNGFQRGDFNFEDRLATIVYPAKQGWGDGRIAVMMEYFDYFLSMERDLLNAGFHLIHLQNKNRWGTDVDNDAKVRFIDYVAQELNLDPRCVCVGLSCGGLEAVNFASRYPEHISFLYLDAPVMNFLSCPMGFGIGNALGENDSGFKELSDAYGFSLSDILLYREHPIDRIPTLIANKLPVALVYGDSDTVVPYIENGKVLEDAYRKEGLPLFCEGKAGCGHHPHGLNDDTELIAFIRQNML